MATTMPGPRATGNARSRAGRSGLKEGGSTRHAAGTISTVTGVRRSEILSASNLPASPLLPRKILIHRRHIRDVRRHGVIEDLLPLAGAERHDAEQHGLRERRCV